MPARAATKCGEKNCRNWAMRGKNACRWHSGRLPGQGWAYSSVDLFPPEDRYCSICGATDRLCVDHSHETGVIRGILCRKHNMLLGFADDSVKHLAAAIAYLSRTPPRIPYKP